jgi:hypothetical protein
MSAVTVSPSGRLQADSETIQRLRQLCSEDEVELGHHVLRAGGRDGANDGAHDGGGQDRAAILRVAPPAGDREIEAMLTGLMIEVYAEARKAFRLARTEARPGGNVYTYEACSSQAARLCRAYAELSMALDRRRGKGHHQKIVVEHVTVHEGGQAAIGGLVGAVNRR